MASSPDQSAAALQSTSSPHKILIWCTTRTIWIGSLAVLILLLAVSTAGTGGVEHTDETANVNGTAHTSEYIVLGQTYSILDVSVISDMPMSLLIAKIYSLASTT